MTQAKTAEEIAIPEINTALAYLRAKDERRKATDEQEQRFWDTVLAALSNYDKHIREAEARAFEEAAGIADEMETSSGGWGNKITYANYSGRVQDAIRTRAAKRGRA